MTQPTHWPTVFVEERNHQRLVTSSRMVNDVRVYRLQCWQLPTEQEAPLVHLEQEDRYWTTDPTATYSTAQEALEALSQPA